MELAIGIGFDGNELTGHAVNLDGQTSALPLKEVFRRGLPTCEKPVRRRIDTNFANWTEVDGQAYLDAFGFNACQASDVNHQFFEVIQDGRTYVVPALALMRAIFRPTKFLLPAMFMPHALDRSCRLNFEGDVASVIVDASWGTSYLASRTLDRGPSLAWMLSHPSAYKMAGSVHRGAMDGRLGLQLPEASARMVFKGREIDRTVFVTEVAITTMTPADRPDFPISGLTSMVVFHKRANQVGGREPTSAARYIVPHNQIGSYSLSEAEWTAIKPILAVKRRATSESKHSPRLLLDGILDKLGTGCPWKRVAYKTGNWLNASAQFQRWDANGKLAAILEVLNESRQQ